MRWNFILCKRLKIEFDCWIFFTFNSILHLQKYQSLSLFFSFPIHWSPTGFEIQISLDLTITLISEKYFKSILYYFGYSNSVKNIIWNFNSPNFKCVHIHSNMSLTNTRKPPENKSKFSMLSFIIVDLLPYQIYVQ